MTLVPLQLLSPQGLPLSSSDIEVSLAYQGGHGVQGVKNHSCGCKHYRKKPNAGRSSPGQPGPVP